jgi:thiol-disulfide isomerase/thioredoxin
MNRRSFILQSTTLFTTLAATPMTASAAPGWAEGSALPDLTKFGLSGSVPALKGKVVYLDFWASWCGPCKSSFPVLSEWQRTFSKQGFTVLGVSVDETDEDMTRFLAKSPVAFPTVRDAGHKLVGAANVSTMPTSFLIDRKGVIRLVHNGFHKQDASLLQGKITALLNES